MRPTIPGLIAAGFLVAPSAVLAVGLNEIDPSACVGVVVPVERALCLTNDVRVRNGVGLLAVDSALEQAAKAHNLDMYTNGFFGHTGSNGSNFAQRMQAAGFVGSPVGELLASGAGTADVAVQLWLDSAPHRAFLLHASANRVGIDFISQSPKLWTMVLGTGPALALKSSVVAGCKSVIGTVTLNAKSATDVVVTLGDTLASASVPATIKILAGATTGNFTVKTTPVSAVESGSVTATIGTARMGQPLTVRPIGLSAVALTPPAVIGSMPVAGNATLECKAGPGPIRVDLSSSMAGVARPVAAFIFVPQGLQSAPFDVATFPVGGKVPVTIAGTASGIMKSKLLTVSPAAAVSPASLAFDYQPVNTTSWVQVANLYNKGAAPYGVTGISLTGTYASQYAQSNNCPAVLPGGSYCTIGVTFKPTTTGSKTAKLSIATSATAAPLSVSLSGTGY